MAPVSGHTSDFAARPDLEFAFFLARELHMTVAELTHRMSNREFLEWQIFYGRRAQEAELARG